MNPPGVENILTRFMPPPIIAGSIGYGLLCCYLYSGARLRGCHTASRDYFPPLHNRATDPVPNLPQSLHTQWPLMRKHWKFLALQGFLIIVCGNGLMFVGLQFTTAINGALINSAEPVTIVLFAWLMFRDQLSVTQWASVFVSFAGVIYLIGQGDADVLLSLNLNIGDVFVFISILCWSVYAVLMRKVPPNLAPSKLPFWYSCSGRYFRLPILDFRKSLLYSNTRNLDHSRCDWRNGSFHINLSTLMVEPCGRGVRRGACRFASALDTGIHIGTSNRSPGRRTPIVSCSRYRAYRSGHLPCDDSWSCEPRVRLIKRPLSENRS